MVRFKKEIIKERERENLMNLIGFFMFWNIVILVEVWCENRVGPSVVRGRLFYSNEVLVRTYVELSVLVWLMDLMRNLNITGLAYLWKAI